MSLTHLYLRLSLVNSLYLDGYSALASSEMLFKTLDMIISLNWVGSWSQVIFQTSSGDSIVQLGVRRLHIKHSVPNTMLTLSLSS